MSKIWLLLLLVAAFQFAQSYPAEYELDDDVDEYPSDEYLSDEQDKKQTTLNIIKQALKKLKDHNVEEFKKKIRAVYKVYCKNLEDVEEDDYESDEVKGGNSPINNLKKWIDKIVKDVMAKLKGNKKIKETFAKAKRIFCEGLKKLSQENDYPEEDGDDEERGLNPFSKGSKNKGNKVTSKDPSKPKKKKKFSLKGIKESIKKWTKKGMELLKNAGVKVNPFECAEKRCKSCIKINLGKEYSACAHIRFLNTNKGTYIVWGIGTGDKAAFEKKMKLGSLTDCKDCGGFLGEVCIQSFEGRAKSSKGQANINFCLGILVKNLGFGIKGCFSYENKKLSFKFKPELFAGSMNEDGDIIKVDETGEEGVTLDADEFEID
uniref:Venom redulysin 4 n=1 Tax=Platymeris rhadamanthus TaxID=1134088 RepID=A0A6B9KZ92_PLARH|nr:venom redulysin 4 [Platymeris rhadamanthus]